MEIKKCTKCGAFIESEDTICSSCANKLSYEGTLLKNYFECNTTYGSISSISAVTGISPTTIQNYMQNNDFDNIPTEIDFKDYYSQIPY
jgi:predicted amidophosphoribosyltransferase